VEVRRGADPAAVNEAFRAAADGPLKTILAYSEAPLVSSDIVGSSASCVFDAGLTKVIDEHHVKVCGWYDNESGFCHRLVDTALLVAGRSS
jgi:glyceraldehyde 3-phosphate dehydrogenase